MAVLFIIELLIAGISYFFWIRYIALNSFKNSERRTAFLFSALKALYFLPVFFTGLIALLLAVINFNRFLNSFYRITDDIWNYGPSAIIGQHKLQPLNALLACILLTVITAFFARVSLTAKLVWERIFYTLLYMVFSYAAIIFSDEASVFISFFENHLGGTNHGLFAGGNWYMPLYAAGIICLLISVKQKTPLFIKYFVAAFKAAGAYLAACMLLPALFFLVIKILSPVMALPVTEKIFTKLIQLMPWVVLIAFHAYFIYKSIKQKPLWAGYCACTISILTFGVSCYFFAGNDDDFPRFMVILLTNLLVLFLLSVILASADAAKKVFSFLVKNILR